MQARLDERFSLHPLTTDERATCESMLGQASVLQHASSFSEKP